jgi:hypothetical protein
MRYGKDNTRRRDFVFSIRAWARFFSNHPAVSWMQPFLRSISTRYLLMLLRAHRRRRWFNRFAIMKY